MKAKKVNDYDAEMEEITLSIPKGTKMISLVSVYTPKDNIGFYAKTDVYDTDDLIKLKGGKNENRN